MFGKLLKHEFRSGLRIFIPIWGSMLLLSVLAGISINTATSSANPYSAIASGFGVVLPVTLLFLLVCAAFVVTFVFIIRRFYTGLLGNEGYLMFTLPVSTGKLLGSRVLTAIIYELLSVIAAIISGLIILLITGQEEFFEVMSTLFSELGLFFRASNTNLLLFAEIILFALVLLCESILRIQLSICLGHLFNRHRAGFSVLMYVGGSWLLQSVITVLTIASNNSSLNWILTTQTDINSTIGAFTGRLGIEIGLYVLLCVGYYFSMYAILRKKLNLE